MTSTLPQLDTGADYLAVKVAVRVDEPATPESIASVRQTFADAAEAAYIARVGKPTA